MPAWTTSLLRALVTVPKALSASTTTTSRPACASARAQASPTTPAPTTTQSASCDSTPPSISFTARSDQRCDRAADLLGGRGPAQVGGARAVAQHRLDRAEDRVVGVAPAEEVEHHRRRPDHRHRVGDAAPPGWQSAMGVLIHGLLELTAIIIACAAGLVMVKSFLFPGTIKRMDSLK